MLKVGIIGSGFGLYGLLPAFILTRNCKVVSICGKQTKRLIDYCHSVGLTKIYSDWQEMLRQEKLDIIAIAVVPSEQYEIAKEAIQKGLHIFAEKPLAQNYQKAEELLVLADKKKITHAVDFIFPEIEAWKKVKQLLDDKTFGKLIHISVNWDFLSFDIKYKTASWKNDVKKGGGALSYYFSHSLYYLEHFAGKIVDVKSQFFYSEENIQNAETGINVLLKFKDNVNGYAHICCNCRGLYRHQVVFQCESGTIILENKNSVVDGFYVQTYTDSGKKQLVMVKNPHNRKGMDERVKIVQKLVKRFIEACKDQTQVIPSFREGTRVQKLIETIRSERIL